MLDFCVYTLHRNRTVNSLRLVPCLYHLHLSDSQALDNSYLRDAQSHLNRAKSIDPANVVAEAFLKKVDTSPAYLIQQ